MLWIWNFSVASLNMKSRLVCVFLFFLLLLLLFVFAFSEFLSWIEGEIVNTKKQIFDTVIMLDLVRRIIEWNINRSR